jgi:hypothetical protein
MFRSIKQYEKKEFKKNASDGKTYLTNWFRSKLNTLLDSSGKIR